MYHHREASKPFDLARDMSASDLPTPGEHVATTRVITLFLHGGYCQGGGAPPLITVPGASLVFHGGPLRQRCFPTTRLAILRYEAV